MLSSLSSLTAAKQLSITLRRSPIGRTDLQRRILLSLGLRKIHQSVVRPNTDQVLGLIDKVKHLVEVKPS